MYESTFAMLSAEKYLIVALLLLLLHQISLFEQKVWKNAHLTALSSALLVWKDRYGETWLQNWT